MSKFNFRNKKRHLINLLMALAIAPFFIVNMFSKDESRVVFEHGNEKTAEARILSSNISYQSIIQELPEENVKIDEDDPQIGMTVKIAPSDSSESIVEESVLWQVFAETSESQAVVERVLCDGFGCEIKINYSNELFRNLDIEDKLITSCDCNGRIQSATNYGIFSVTIFLGENTRPI
ncbi:MAG: hypothetical protein ACOY3E_17885 [Pseudomonadota bacterium]